MPIWPTRSSAIFTNKPYFNPSLGEPINWTHKGYYGGMILMCDRGSAYLNLYTENSYGKFMITLVELPKWDRSR